MSCKTVNQQSFVDKITWIYVYSPLLRITSRFIPLLFFRSFDNVKWATLKAGTVERWNSGKITPNPKTRNGGKSPQINYNPTPNPYPLRVLGFGAIFRHSTVPAFRVAPSRFGCSLWCALLRVVFLFLLLLEGKIWRRLENKTPRKIMNMDREKMSSKDCSEISGI